MSEARFSRTERALILLGLVFMFGAGSLYFSGFSIQRILFGWDQEKSGRKVGLLTARDGSVRRQLGASTEFRDIDLRADLYNEDTLVTSLEGGAKFELDDGSLIELGPGTMIKLVFDSELSLQGISRRANIEVVTGSVSGVAKSKNVVFRNRSEVVRLDTAEKKIMRAVPRSGVIAAPEARPTVQVAPQPVVVPTPVAVAIVPSPIPTPTATASPSPVVRVIAKVQLVSPKMNHIMAADPKLPEPYVHPTFEWLVAPLDQALEIAIRKVGSHPVEILRKTVTPNRGHGSLSTRISEPGVYEWELLAPAGTRLGMGKVSARFSVSPEVRKIEILHPMVGSSESESNRYEGEVKNKFEGITLRWHPLPSANSYRIWLLKKPKDVKPIMDRTVTSPSYSFNKGKLFTGTIYYKIMSPMAHGWVAVSESAPFSFNFMPPALVIPENESVVTAGNMSRSDNSVLMTWQRMNFTTGYELEIATDPEFKQVIQKHLSKENFMVVKSLAIGRLWWRVRCYTKEVSSPFSAPNLLVISQ